MSLSKAALNMAEALRPVLVKLIPQKMLSAVKAKVIEKGAKDLEKTEITPFEPQAHKKGINLIGSIKSDTGLGQSMRLVAEILENSTWDYTVYDYFVPPGGSRTNEAFDGKITQTGPYNINLIHVNPSELPLAFMDVGKNQWDTRYNIGYWLWELEEFPKEWLPAFHLLDEVWTPSEFISQNLRKYTDKPVYTMPYSVTAPADAAYDRDYFHLPKDRFLFLMMYDSGSGMVRKNPLGAIEAFKQAFDRENKQVGLVIKMNRSEQSEKDIENIRTKLDGYDNIYFICETLSKTAVNSLTACVDVFVSLHRAEGFGLVMAEAMLLGTPVIATNWSANTEFMNRESACMVDYKKTAIEQDIPPFKKGYHWAEADVAQAAAYMKQLCEDSAFYEQKKAAAEAYIREKTKMQHSVSLLEDRLGKILEERK